MAQAPAAFASPPGLEQQREQLDLAFAATGGEVRTSAIESLEDKLSKLGPNADRRDIVQVVREVVLEEVDHKVSQKAAELLARGKEMINNLQQKHREKISALQVQVAKCQEKQGTLEAENETLKEALQSLTTRFTMLSSVLSGKGLPEAGGNGESALTSTPPRSVVDRSRAGPFHSPDVLGRPSGEALAAERSTASDKLPAVPAFPFPAPPSSPAAPLSLAEALGTQTPQRTPLSLANSLTPSPELTASPYLPRGTTSNCMFSFTLRKADGAELGLNVSHHENDTVLRVEGVRPDGAVEAWNRQCAGSPSAEKAVMIGDKIISVNNVSYDPPKMLEECRDKMLLKLTILRGEYPLPAFPAKAGPPGKHTALRADASVFVPRRADAPAASRGTEEAKLAETGASDAAPATSTGSSNAASAPEATAERV